MPNFAEKGGKGPANSLPPSARTMVIPRVEGAMCLSTISHSAAVMSLLHFTRRIILKRVKSSTHNIAYLLPERDVSWKGPVRSTKGLPPRLLNRISVTFGTAYRRILASEHCTHGTYVSVSCTPGALTVPHLISSLECPRR